ncbi:dihydroorotate dehydrogenase [Candidatus Desantisbacteria bacterium]|nr:dihydroorotate dehydrogenase [Candidatus Desantisbacteria bacterium]
MQIEPDVSVSIGKLKLKNPVLCASGCFGYGQEYAELIDLSMLGGIILKGITLKERQGNPMPRIVETPAGMLNSVGLQNMGLPRFLQEKLPLLSNIPTAVIANICGETPEEYAVIAKGLSDKAGINALEINISCPNVSHGGMLFGQDMMLTFEVVNLVRKQTSLPLIVKLSPNVTNIASIARAAVDGGADAVSLINTLMGMAVDIKTQKPRLANITGGLSGPAIKPVALRMVWEVCKSVNIPVIGQGGIMDWEDSLEFLLVGATAVCIGTANFVNPKAGMEIVQGIKDYMRQYKIVDIGKIKMML